jgi:hypothetical protein
MGRSKEYISSLFKEDSGNKIILFLLTKNPELTIIQLKRIMVFTYNRLHSKEGKKVYDEQKNLSKYRAIPKAIQRKI